MSVTHAAIQMCVPVRSSISCAATPESYAATPYRLHSQCESSPIRITRCESSQSMQTASWVMRSVTTAPVANRPLPQHRPQSRPEAISQYSRAHRLITTFIGPAPLEHLVRVHARSLRYRCHTYPRRKRLLHNPSLLRNRAMAPHHSTPCSSTTCCFHDRIFC